jgi:hypothetical protein
MSTFPELSGFKSEVDGDKLTLPIRGVEYRFSKSIPMRLGLALTEAREQTRAIAEAVNAGAEPEVPAALASLSEHEVMRALIGDQWQRMLDDGVLDTEFRHVYMVLFTWHMGGEDAAMRVWTGEVGEGDARPPARSSSKARTTSRSTSTRKPSASTGRRASGGKTS